VRSAEGDGNSEHVCLDTHAENSPIKSRAGKTSAWRLRGRWGRTRASFLQTIAGFEIGPRGVDMLPKPVEQGRWVFVVAYDSHILEMARRIPRPEDGVRCV
jgi:hypothetical protein